jgi:transcriptional activator
VDRRADLRRVRWGSGAPLSLGRARPCDEAPRCGAASPSPISCWPTTPSPSRPAACTRPAIACAGRAPARSLPWGRADEAATELTALVAEDPLREELVAELMGAR